MNKNKNDESTILDQPNHPRGDETVNKEIV